MIFSRLSAGAAALAAVCVAGAQTYATKVQDIRAGIVILDSAKANSTSYPESIAPYALYNLDKSDAKPAGWNIYNPHAPGAVTNQIQARSASLYGQSPTIGSRLTKRNAEYWNVFLGQTTDTVLSDYDLLLLNPRYLVQLNPSEREKLRRFVDRGGVLWIDPSGATNIDQINNWPLAASVRSFTNFNNAFADVSNPLLSYPQRVSRADLRMLMAYAPTKYGLTFIQPGTPAIDPLIYPLYADFQKYVSAIGVVDGNTEYPVVGMARLGDGAVVVTTTGMSQQLNRVLGSDFGGNLNNAYTGRNPVLEADGAAAAKVAVNIASLASDYREQRGGPRNTGGSTVAVGAPTLTRFTDERNPAVPTQSPVLYKGVLVSVVGDHLVVEDANPGADLDGDGDPDDGQPDSAIGETRDEIWESGTIGTGTLSSPVCVQLPNVTGNPEDQDQVIVVDSSGALHAFKLFVKNNGRLVGNVPGPHVEFYSIPAPTGTVSGSGTPLAPTVSEGFAYVATRGDATNGGTVWMADLAGRTRQIDGGGSGFVNNFYVGGANSGLPSFTAPPTIGYVPVTDASGGADLIAYGPGVFPPQQVGGQQAPGFVSLWIGVKGEKPVDDLTTMTQAGGLVVRTRAGSPQNGGQAAKIYLPSSGDPIHDSTASLGVHLTLLDNAGNPLNASQMSGLLSGSVTQNNEGELTFGYASGVTPASFQQALRVAGVTGEGGIRIDYYLDWSDNAGSNAPAIRRGDLRLPITPNVDRQILGPIAMSARGTLHMTVGRPIVSSSPADYLTQTAASVPNTFYSIREDAGRGFFRVVNRFNLYPRYNSASGTGTVTPVPSVFEDEDPIKAFAGGLLGAIGSPSPLAEFRFAGPPAVRGDIVYAAAVAQKPMAGSTNVDTQGIPVTVLMAFKADPETPEIRITGLPDNVSVRQPDFDRSGIDTGERQLNAITPGQTSTLGMVGTNSGVWSSSLSYDRDSGVLRLDNLASGTQGQLLDCISLSQPIVIHNEGAADVTFDPNVPPTNVAGGTVTGPSRWSPLLWYTVFNGSAATNGPLVTGSTVYMAGTSFLPKLLASSPPVDFSTLSPSGLLWAMSGDASPNSDFLRASTNRNYQSQVVHFSPDGSFKPNPDILMPQIRGATGFSDYAQRLASSTLGTSTVAYGVVGGNGVAAAWGDKGVYGMNRGDFIVCDQGRVIRVDAAGNPLSVRRASTNAGSAGGFVGNIRSLVRPTRAIALPNGDTLVVDSGGNRVFQVDDTGVESRSITTFFPDTRQLPAGYQANEPLSLREPRDVVTWSNYVSRAATGFSAPVDTTVPDTEYWVHYLIADTGNQRLVEIVDRYSVDPNTGAVGDPIRAAVDDPNTPDRDESQVAGGVPQLGVLAWQTPANFGGKRLDYNSVSRVYLQDANGANGRYVYFAGTGSGTTNLTGSAAVPGSGVPDRSAGNGGVVVFDPNSPVGTVVFDGFARPLDASGNNLVPAKFSAVNSVTAKTYHQGTTFYVRVMVTDANGVYEFLYTPPTNASASSQQFGAPNWMLNEQGYQAARGNDASLRFRPLYARRLDSGDILLVNGYQGRTKSGGSTDGEVLMVDGSIDTSRTDSLNGWFGYGKTNYGFIPFSVKFLLPPLSSVRGLQGPVFADRR